MGFDAMRTMVNSEENMSSKLPFVCAALLSASGVAAQAVINLPSTTVTRKDAARQEVRDAISVGTTRKTSETSTDRTDPPSKAHDRGAVDIRSNDISYKDRHSEGKNISSQ